MRLQNYNRPKNKNDFAGTIQTNSSNTLGKYLGSEVSTSKREKDEPEYLPDYSQAFSSIYERNQRLKDSS